MRASQIAAASELVHDELADCSNSIHYVAQLHEAVDHGLRRMPDVPRAAICKQQSGATGEGQQHVQLMDELLEIDR